MKRKHFITEIMENLVKAVKNGEMTIPQAFTEIDNAGEKWGFDLVWIWGKWQIREIAEMEVNSK